MNITEFANWPLERQVRFVDIVTKYLVTESHGLSTLELDEEFTAQITAFFAPLIPEDYPFDLPRAPFAGSAGAPRCESVLKEMRLYSLLDTAVGILPKGLRGERRNFYTIMTAYFLAEANGNIPPQISDAFANEMARFVPRDLTGSKRGVERKAVEEYVIVRFEFIPVADLSVELNQCKRELEEAQARLVWSERNSAFMIGFILVLVVVAAWFVLLFLLRN